MSRRKSQWRMLLGLVHESRGAKAVVIDCCGVYKLEPNSADEWAFRVCAKWASFHWLRRRTAGHATAA